MTARCVLVCVVVPLILPALCGRDISTIRYHFTTCGSTGRAGPSYEDCKRHYDSADSPLARDGALTDVHGDTFVGSQSFRPPRSTRYNFTIAAAAGGRGLCNVEFGRGLTVRTSAFLHSTVDYLILVGQKGLGPCDSDVTDAAEILTLCGSPPDDLDSSERCRQRYVEWVRNQTDLEFQRTLALSGGGGGGGASFVGEKDIRPEGDIRVYGISGGGGGTPALLDYSSLDALLPGTSESNISLYKSFINGNTSIYNPYIADNAALRGYRVEVDSRDVTAGAGGGFFSNASFSSNQQDGRPVGRMEEFAVGGLQCARNDFSRIPTELRWGDGGFGGGGGGCGGGGGGGGITGGPVLGAENTVPGGGGYTFVTEAFKSNVTLVASDGDYNEGDGYVDIVAADCGCVFQCMVYEEEDKFQCHCPDSTQLAPDLSDCFQIVEQDVAASNETLVPVEGYQLRLVITGNATIIYSMNTLLQTERSDSLCAIAFLGENQTGIVAVSEPAQGTERVMTLSLTTVNSTDGTFHFSDYVQWLSEPQIIAGALLISTGDCSFADNTINMSVSLQADLNESVKEILSVQDKDGGSVLQEFLESHGDTLGDFLAAVLQTDRQTADSREPLLSVIQLLCIVGGGALLCLFCSCAVSVVAILWCRKRQRHRKGAWSPPDHVTHQRNIVASTSTLLSNHAYNRYTSCVPNKTVQLPTSPPRPSLSSVHSLGPNHEYEFLSFADEELRGSEPSVNSPLSTISPPTSPIPLLSARSGLREAVLESSTLLSPKFGHSAPLHDFVRYNRSRADSGALQWQFPRSSLVYLRELGEGQFGKVLLMKTQEIAGYRGSIPVAVKTLSSQEPEVIGRFLEEAELMKKFSHPNIVSILGVCTGDVDETSAPLMILEYMQFGDLLSFLQAYRPTGKGTKVVIRQEHFFCFATDVARALEFLANSKFVHRDIAARNCLVGTNLVVKIADFGLARGVHDKDYYRVAGTQILPVRAMSPESLLYGVFTTASDVWSYGVLLWEIVTYGGVPLMGLSTEDVIRGAQDQALQHHPPPECPPLLSSLISQCHNHHPDQRPTFAHILSLLPH